MIRSFKNYVVFYLISVAKYGIIRCAALAIVQKDVFIINTSLNFMLHQQRIQIFHSLSHDLIACSGYSRTRQ